MSTEKLFRRIKKQVGQAIDDFGLIAEGDRIAVGVSGGKDSYTLLYLLEELRKRAPVAFTLIAVNVDSGFPGYRSEIVENYLQTQNFHSVMKKTNCYQIIEAKRRPGSSYCSFCARLRRGVLYTLAAELGCNKIALGHHLDDFIETLLLNQFHGGTLAAMSPKLLADNGQTTIIRPLVYVEESDIIQFSRQHTFPVICCACPVCGTLDQQRQKMKQLIHTLALDIPHIRRSMLAALGNIQPRHLLSRGQRLDNPPSSP